MVDVNCANVAGVTPLLYAANHGNKALVKVLLDEGADPDKTNNNGCTPLHWAVNSIANQEVVQLLMAHGAELNKADNRGWTPLHVAAYHDVEDILNILLDGGADPTMPKVGRTPLWYRAYRSSLGISKSVI